MSDYGQIQTAFFDHGAQIGVAVEYKGERRAVRIPHPFAEEINAEWHSDPRHKCAVVGCAYCDV